MIYRKILFVPFQALTEEKNRILYLREEWEFFNFGFCALRLCSSKSNLWLYLLANK